MLFGHFRYRENRTPFQARYSLGPADWTAEPSTFQTALPLLNKGIMPAAARQA